MRVFSFVATFLLVSACSSPEPDARLPKLYGSWQGVEWTEGSQDRSAKAGKIRYTFAEDGTYVADLNGFPQSGTYEFTEGSLVLTPVDSAGRALDAAGIYVRTVSATDLVFSLGDKDVREILKLQRR